jgi:hypothetical protein
MTATAISEHALSAEQPTWTGRRNHGDGAISAVFSTSFPPFATTHIVYYLSLDNHELPGEKGTVLHSHLIHIYVKALDAQREREAEHERLAALEVFAGAMVATC